MEVSDHWNVLLHVTGHSCIGSWWRGCGNEGLVEELLLSLVMREISN